MEKFEGGLLNFELFFFFFVLFDEAAGLLAFFEGT